MRTIKALLFSTLLGVASGCASLKVDVEVYKPPIPSSPAELNQFARAALASSAFEPDARQKAYQALSDQIRDAYKAAIERTPEGKANPGAADILWQGTKRNLDSALQPLSVAADQVYGAALALDSSTVQQEDDDSLFRAQLSNLRKALAAHGVQAGMFQGQLAAALGYPLSPLQRSQILKLAEITLTRGIAANADLSGRAVGYPIFDDRITSLATDKDRWAPFSSSTFSSTGGNSQFVVVREGTVVFHQKSLDFDPTSVVGAGTALTRLGLQMAAAIATGSAMGKKAGAQSDTSKDDVEKQTLVNEAETEANQALLERRTTARRQLLLDLAKVLEETESTEKLTMDAKVDDKIKEIRTKFSRLIEFFQGQTAKPEGSK